MNDHRRVPLQKLRLPILIVPPTASDALRSMMSAEEKFRSHSRFCRILIKSVEQRVPYPFYRLLSPLQIKKKHKLHNFSKFKFHTIKKSVLISRLQLYTRRHLIAEDSGVPDAARLVLPSLFRAIALVEQLRGEY